MRTPPNERVSSDIVETGAPPAAGSERRCVLSGQSFARDALIRLAISPTGEVLPDPLAKAPGRGAWIAPDRGALSAAIADGAFRRALLRAFKGGGAGVSLSYSDDLPQVIEAALTRTLLDRLGLEKRSGNIVLGAAKIEEHARTGRIALMLHAKDAAQGSRRKLDQAWRVGCDLEGTGVQGSVLPLDRDGLSVALGRENVVHLGVSGVYSGSNSKKSAAYRVAQAVNRLAAYMGDDPPPDLHHPQAA